MKIEIFEAEAQFLLPSGEGRGVAGSLSKLKGGYRPKLTSAYEGGRGEGSEIGQIERT